VRDFLRVQHGLHVVRVVGHEAEVICKQHVGHQKNWSTSERLSPRLRCYLCHFTSYKLRGLTASQVVRLIGLLLVFASQKIVHNVQNEMAVYCAVEKENQRQSD